jgi:hypothetical protein
MSLCSIEQLDESVCLYACMLECVVFYKLKEFVLDQAVASECLLYV